MRLALKVLMVIAMTVGILVPLLLIGSVVDERQAYQAAAVQTVAGSYAGAQSIAGPVLVVPYVETVDVEEKDDKGVSRKVRREQRRQWTFFPQRFDLGGTLQPSTRTLGLYDVRVYELAGVAKATFRVDIPSDADAIAPRRIGRPSLAYGVADVRGLTGVSRLTVGGRDVTLAQGMGVARGTGVHAQLEAPVAGQILQLDTVLTFSLGGTESLAVSPLGASNRIAISSSWPHPQFNGAFLPRTRSIDSAGFRAEWEVSSLATNAQAQYLEGQRASDDASSASDSGNSSLDAVGVSLVDPVNPYSKADRATKYGLLFVVLTFVGFFMFELIKGLRIHPLQYALVGLALAIFFLLLVSLSEHVSFGGAYLYAATACIGLLGVYVGAILRSSLRGFGFAAMLATLYAALYGLLLSEDNALVLGSGLLFVILAAVMLVTRKVDWYALSAGIPVLPTRQVGT